MTPEIIENKEASTQEWEQVWSHCDYATFFHSPDWMNIWSQYYDGILKPCVRKVTFEDGKSVILILSVKKRLKGLINIYESAPSHVYGGWISKDDLTNHHADKLSLYLINTYPNLIWRVNPFEPHSSNITGKTWFENDLTFAVPLQMNLDDLHSKMRKRKILKKVKIAERNHFYLEKIQHHHLNDYYEIYRQASQRWLSKGKQPNLYSSQLFKYIFDSDNCDFWGVFQGQRMICAGPILKSKNHVVTWLGIASTEDLQKKPYEFFYYNLIQYYKNNHYSWFDFNPSGGLKGVEHFKKGFATQELSAPVIDSRSSILKKIQHLKSTLS